MWVLHIILNSGYDLTYAFSTKEKAREIYKGVKSEYIRWLSNQLDKLDSKEDPEEDNDVSMFIEFGDGEGNEVFFPAEQLCAVKLESRSPDKHRSLQIEHLELSNKEIRARTAGDDWRT